MSENRKQFLVMGKRWFQKSYGNTYHSVKVVDLNTGETIQIKVGVYGYGDQYRQTGVKILQDAGLLEGKEPYFRYNDKIQFEVSDVGREKDLYF